MQFHLNARRVWQVILLDLLILTELSACLAVAFRFGDRFTPVFLAVYPPLVLLTLFGGKKWINRHAGRTAGY